jgi:hypothetical protein
VVGHAGARLLTDLADKTALTSGFVHALGLDRVRRSAHERGRVAVDLAVLMADGGEAIADLAVLRQQPGLFGPVAWDPTIQLNELAGLAAELDQTGDAEYWRTTARAVNSASSASCGAAPGSSPAARLTDRPSGAPACSFITGTGLVVDGGWSISTTSS